MYLGHMVTYKDHNYVCEETMCGTGGGVRQYQDERT